MANSRIRNGFVLWPNNEFSSKVAEGEDEEEDALFNVFRYFPKSNLTFGVFVTMPLI